MVRIAFPISALSSLDLDRSWIPVRQVCDAFSRHWISWLNRWGIGRKKRKKRQLACKPGSVWPRFPGTWQPFIWDSICTLPHATHPDDWPGNRLWPRLRVTRVIPIRSCSRWGLPCRPCCQRRGGLLPHPFTLTSRTRRFAFCGTFPEVALAGRYPAPYFRGARTFLTLPPFGIGKARLPGQLATRA